MILTYGDFVNEEWNLEVITFGEFMKLWNNNTYRSQLIAPNDFETRDREQLGVIVAHNFMPIKFSDNAQALLYPEHHPKRYVTGSATFELTLQEVSDLHTSVKNEMNLNDLDDIIYFHMYPQLVEAQMLSFSGDSTSEVWSKVVNGGAASRDKLKERRFIGVNLTEGQLQRLYEEAKWRIEGHEQCDLVRFEVEGHRITVRVQNAHGEWVVAWTKPIN